MNTRHDTWNSEHYKKYASLQNHEWALVALENLTFNGSESILDIGCGDGNITAKMAHSVPNGRVIGIDLSPSMIKAAKESYAHVTNLSFEIADATNFSFSQRFDFITSFFTLHWIEDQLTVLENIKNALTPNGTTIIIMSASQEKTPIIFQAFEHLKQDETWANIAKKANKRYFPQSPNDFESLLHQAGFVHVKIGVVYRTSSSPNLEANIQSLMRWIPHSTELPHDLALKFSQALAEDMYQQLNKEPHEPISFEQAFLLVEAY